MYYGVIEANDDHSQQKTWKFLNCCIASIRRFQIVKFTSTNTTPIGHDYYIIMNHERTSTTIFVLLALGLCIRQPVTGVAIWCCSRNKMRATTIPCAPDPPHHTIDQHCWPWTRRLIRTWACLYPPKNKQVATMSNVISSGLQMGGAVANIGLF